MALPMLFDLDGTLVHSLPDIAASANHVRRHYDLPEAGLEDVRAWLGDGLPALLRQCLAPVLDSVSLDDAQRVYRGHHREQCTRLVAPFHGVEDHLAAWHDEGRPLGVVTNKPEGFARAILGHLGLDRYLPVVVGGDTTPERKPHPLPVLAALDLLGAGAQGGLMVGDSRNDVEAGRRAGLRTAAVTYGYSPAEELTRLAADEYWSSFGARPDGRVRP